MKCGIKSGRPLTVFVSSLWIPKKFQPFQNCNKWGKVLHFNWNHILYYSSIVNCFNYYIYTAFFQFYDMLMGLIHLKVAQTHCFVFIENVLNISWWVLYSVSDMLIASYSPWRFQSWIYILFRVYQRKHTIGVWERKTTNIFNMAELLKQLAPLYTKGSEN